MPQSSAFPTAAYGAAADPRESPWGFGMVASFAAIYGIWGSTYLAIRYALEGFPPLTMGGIRFVAAGLLLYGWGRGRSAERPRLAHWRAAAPVGGLLFLGGNGGLAWAEQRVPSGVAVLVFAALAWSVGSLRSRMIARPASMALAMGMQCLAGGALLLITGGAVGEWTRIDPATLSPRPILALAYLIVFGTILAFTAYTWLLAHTTAARVATYAFVNPVIALLLGWGLGGEPLNPRILAAAGLVVFAVALIVLGAPRRRERGGLRGAGASPPRCTPDRIVAIGEEERT